MGNKNTLTIRVPEELKNRIETIAAQQGISINQFAMYAFTKEIGELEAGEFFRNISRSADKKELFYRSALPLVLHANEQIAVDRKHLKELYDRQKAGNDLKDDDLRWLRQLAVEYRVRQVAKGADDQSSSKALVDAEWQKLLVRVDEIPPSLALGQAA